MGATSIVPELHARIAALEAEVKRYREALRKIADHWKLEEPACELAADIARAALSEPKGSDDEL